MQAYGWEWAIMDNCSRVVRVFGRIFQMKKISLISYIYTCPDASERLKIRFGKCGGKKELKKYQETVMGSK